MIRQPAVAGKFYPSDPDELREELSSLVLPGEGARVIGLVAPHAGYLYSGKTAGLVYGAAGLVFNLFFKWNTSLAFGVTGVLWALGPMMAVFRQLSKGKIAGSVVFATICGALVLLGWGALDGLFLSSSYWISSFSIATMFFSVACVSLPLSTLARRSFMLTE